MTDRINSEIASGVGLDKAQYGFRKGRSTTDALLNFSVHVKKILNYGRAALLLFLDISVAFNCAK